MRKIYKGILVSILCFFRFFAIGQVIIASQDFEVAPATPTLVFTTVDLGAPGSASGFTTGTSGTTAAPANSNLFTGGLRGYRLAGPASGSATTTRILTFGSINTSGFSSVQFTFRVAGMSIGSTSNGMDENVGIDQVLLEVSPNGGTSWYQQTLLNIVGTGANARWGFNVTGVGTRAYQSDNLFSTFSVLNNTAGGATLTGANAISQLSVSNLPSVSNLQIKISLQCNSANESWIIDDAILSGTVAAVPIVSSSLLSGTVGTASSFNVDATNSPTSYAIVSGSLPPGLTLNTTTGLINGTPTSSGTFTVEISATNGTGTSTTNGTIIYIISGATPLLTVTPTSLTGFSYLVGTGPSVSQTFTLSGTNLSGAPSNVLITAPTDYEISSDNTIFSNSINVPYTSSTLASTTVYVRLKAGLAAGNYNLQNVAASASGAVTKNVTCSGTVLNNPSIAINSLPVPASNINIGSFNNVIYGLSMAVTNSNTTLNQLTIPITATSNADFAASGFKLWYNTTNSFAGAILLNAGINPIGANLTFTGLTQSLSVGTTGYFFITADVSSLATASNTIFAGAMPLANALFAGTVTKTGSPSAGGLKTIVLQAYTAFDTFDRPNNTTVGIPSSGGAVAWTELENSDVNRASIIGNQLRLANCLTGSCTFSREAVSFDISSKYSTNFSSANATLEWYFNMKQSRIGGDLSNFGAGYGMAFIFGANESDIRNNTVDGYAVLMGESGTSDPIRLVHFTNGIENYTSIIDVPSPNTKTNYMSIRVTFNPCTNRWGLLVRDDGGTTFADPTTITGTEVSAINNTYTNINLNYLGALWNHNSSPNEYVFFDNIYIPSGVASINTYTWNATTPSDYQLASNWTPARTCPKVNDVLVFDGTSPVNSTVINVPTQTIGKLLISGNRNVIFKDVSGDATTSTLTIGGGTGTDFSVENGSIFRFDVAASNNTSDAIVINLSNGTTGLIDGSLFFQNSNSGTAGRPHQLLATDVSGIIVSNTGMVSVVDLTGNVFGTSGSQNVVIFQNGSVYESLDGGSPFGFAQPDSKVVFNTGSTYQHKQSSDPSFSGRVYGNFTFDYSVSPVTITLGGNTAVTMSNFNVSSGTLNIVGNTTTPLPMNIRVKGDLVVSSGATLNFSPTVLAAASTIAFNSTSANQRINNAGTLILGRYATLEQNNTGIAPNNKLNIETDITIAGTLKITAGELNLTSGNITLKSDFNSTANVSNVTGTIAYGTGRFIIERYLFAKKAWRFLATPVQIGASPTVNESWREGVSALTSNGFGTRITGPEATPGATVPTGGLDEYTLRGSLKYFSATTNNYVEITGTNLNANYPIANNEGYYVFIRGDRGIPVSGSEIATTLRMRGQLRTGTQIFTVLPQTAMGIAGFTSVGNPFASRIDMRTVDFNNVAKSFYIWDPNAPGNHNVGKFEQFTYNATGHFVGSGGTVKDTIESGQAFFVQNNNVGSPSGTLVIKESDKISGSANVSRVGVTQPTLEINLLAKDANANYIQADAVSLNFENNYSNAIDNKDVRKISNTFDNISIKKPTANLVVERRNILTETDTIQLQIAGMRVADYRLEIDPSVLATTELEGILIDKFLQTQTAVSLVDVTSVNFAITSNPLSRAADRFMIVFKAAPTANFANIKAIRNTDNTTKVEWAMLQEKNIASYEIQQSSNAINFNTILTETNVANNNQNNFYAKIDAQASTNKIWYRVKANFASGIVKYSAVAMVNEVLSKPTDVITQSYIYPNPVVNKNAQLVFESAAQGNYTINITNSIGQLVYSQNITVNVGTLQKSLNVSTLAKGKYNLQLSKVDGSKVEDIDFILQ
jgi:hypothetical protein